MKLKNDRLEIAIIFSVFLHFVLIGLLLIGSFFTKMIQYSSGGSGGDQDSFEAVMVDTGQVAEEYNRLVAPVTKNLPDKFDEEQPKEATSEIVESEQVAKVDDLEASKIAEKEKKQQLEQQREEQKKIQQKQQKKQEVAKQQEETRKKLAEQARLKAEAEAKRLEALAKQAEEDRKAKAKAKAEQEAKVKAEKEAKAKAEQEAKAKAEKEAKAKAEQEAKVKAEKEAKAKAEQEAKAKAEKEAKAKAEKEAKAKAEKEAKAKAEQEAKAKAEKEAKARDAARAQQLLDGTLGQGSNRNQSGSKGSGGTTGVGQGSALGNRYLDQISRLLRSKFRNANGQSCYVRIFIERNGVIRNYQVIKGPADVCDAATRAIVATGKVPPAPSDAIYQQYSSPTIEFRP
ncbi:cell envelope integrity protein TolA [Otariodibacter sp.]|uniref:cell envelope integrity protein TolA n=1 Tax=Otariodibacter sp. TaxID=3030919 RepID=UPI002629604F|nr:cell envelope integrity protein TolA [Otariodibacter sp.]